MGLGRNRRAELRDLETLCSRDGHFQSAHPRPEPTRTPIGGDRSRTSSDRQSGPGRRAADVWGHSEPSSSGERAAPPIAVIEFDSPTYNVPRSRWISLTVGSRPLRRSLDRAARAPSAALAIGRHRHWSPRGHRHLSSLWAGPFFNADVQRFSALSVEPALPYQDHAVDHAPVELGVIRMIGSSDTRATATG